MSTYHPGIVVLFGSGESAPASGKAYEAVARKSPHQPRIAVLETPAGFEPNSDAVADKSRQFFEKRLQNYEPRVKIIPARKKGTDFSPDDPAIVTPILEADWVMMGPGSPSYAARQLKNSLAWEMLRTRHRMGATAMFASASVLAVGKYTLPVYEIYKVGEELHWKEGLDFFSQFNIPLTVIPHWNNSDGGDDLDTSRCYMGQARYERLLEMLPSGQTILGIDEHTAVILNLQEGHVDVMGIGRAIIFRDGQRLEFQKGSDFPIDQLGEWQFPKPSTGIDPALWQQAVDVQAELSAEAEMDAQPPEDVLMLVEARTVARQEKAWSEADRLRAQIEALGWQVMDTPDGAELVPLEE